MIGIVKPTLKGPPALSRVVKCSWKFAFHQPGFFFTSLLCSEPSGYLHILSQIGGYKAIGYTCGISKHRLELKTFWTPPAHVRFCLLLLFCFPRTVEEFSCRVYFRRYCRMERRVKLNSRPSSLPPGACLGEYRYNGNR